MPAITVLKPRRNNSPFTFNGVKYPQIVDDVLGIVTIEVEDPEFLTFISQNPDTFEISAEDVPNEPAAEEADQPVVVTEAADEVPVAVVAAEQEQDPADTLKAPAVEHKAHAKQGRKSRLN